MPKTEIPSFRVKKPPRFSRHSEPGYVVRGRIWLEKDSELYIGWGRVILLERIDKLGSIAAAARSMRLGYRNAWLWVEAMNRLAPAPLVEKTTGGVGGGQARLTEEGQRVIAQYKELRSSLQEFLKQAT
jgi:molybdate transport system regulatory protein